MWKKKIQESLCFTISRTFESISSFWSWKYFPECEHDGHEHDQNTEQRNEAVSRLTSFVQEKCFYTIADAWHKILG